MDSFWGANPLFLELTPIGGGENAPLSTTLILGIAAVVVAVVAVAVVIVLRARGRKQKEEEAKIELPKK
jgi:multisubunit Na+/H+ antiporter MnhC subunit